MKISIDRINKNIESLRQDIINHKAYALMEDLDDLKTFMQYHVFAVWDFMSLLKTLQNNLTCTTVPWIPKGSAETRFLINEIVVGEESDIDQNGVRKSHFEIYLEAMEQCGADTSIIRNFIAAIQETGDVHKALAQSNIPKEAKSFVSFTFSIIESNKDYLQSAIFTFGREDLIPGMFLSIIKDLDKKFPGNISIFKYYLERHIEVDGDHHSHLAMQMTSNLCGENDTRWEEAEKAIIESLKKRLELWDGVYESIKAMKKSAVL